MTMKAAGPDDAIRRLLDSYRRGDATVQDELARSFARIAAVDRAGPTLNTVLRIDPDAQWTARRLDAERSAGAAVGPLHGVPVLLKDNVDTGGPGGGSMATSAGALALADSFAPADAPLVQRLRAAGALVIGKTNMTELANYMSTGMPGGYSSLGGQVINPHHPALPVSTSSSGSAAAVAAGLCPVAIGTETAGSILVPAFANGIVGIKPTVGLVSRTGIVPIAFSQDTAGPFARSVEDAARVLAVIAGPDPEDAATHGAPAFDFRPHLRPDGLRGARIGIPRAGFWDEQGSGWAETLKQVSAALREGGAEVVDPADIATRDAIAWSPVLLYEFKAAMNAYLRRLGPGAPCRTLADLIAFNAAQCGPRAALRAGVAAARRARNLRPHGRGGVPERPRGGPAPVPDRGHRRHAGAARAGRPGVPERLGLVGGRARRLSVGGGAARVRAGRRRQRRPDRAARRDVHRHRLQRAHPGAHRPWLRAPHPRPRQPDPAGYVKRPAT